MCLYVHRSTYLSRAALGAGTVLLGGVELGPAAAGRPSNNSNSNTNTM